MAPRPTTASSCVFPCMLALSKGLYSASRDIHVSPSESTGLNADLYHPHPNRQLQDQNSLKSKIESHAKIARCSVLARGGTCKLYANFRRTTPGHRTLGQALRHPFLSLELISFTHEICRCRSTWVSSASCRARFTLFAVSSKATTGIL